MDKNKTLKNSSENVNMDSGKDEKKSNISSDIGDIKNNESDSKLADTKTIYDDNNSTSDLDNFSLDLAVLNEASRIAKMGMSSISFLTSKIQDTDMKKVLVAMYSQYSNILAQINQHFEKYGEVPDDSPAYTKMMSFCGIKMNLMKDSTTSHIAEMMIQGTLMGVIECQKILNCNLDIEDSTKKLLKDFNKFQRDNIDRLNAYL